MFLYNVAIRLYVFLVYLATPFNSKARKLITGRKGFFTTHQPEKHKKYTWFHCASLGEFEQARPLIEKIKKENPGSNILLSFFSSSGYEIRKNYAFADQVIYLPFDFASNANKFFGTFNISMAVFVKYDVWPNYLNELLSRKIPVFLTSATFRETQFYFKWYGKFLREKLQRINKIFVQDQDSLELIKKHDFKNAERTGDVRIDRVLEIKSSNEKLPEIEIFVGGSGCVVFGSVYSTEIDLIKQLINNSDQKIIIAPHDISKENIEEFIRRIPGVLLMSEFSNYSAQRVLLINNIGMLSKLYKYATSVYVGGGFGKGIHNILEPAVWGIPVYIGPNFHKFPEAITLIEAQLVYSEKNLSGIAKIMCSNMKDLNKNNFTEFSTKWFHKNSGATQLIYRELESLI